MSNHTAGPWFVSSNQVFAKQGDRIAYLAECDEQALADARLIAAAPEMLEALGRIEALHCNLRYGGPAPEDLQSLSDALEEACNTASNAIALATKGAQP